MSPMNSAVAATSKPFDAEHLARVTIQEFADTNSVTPRTLRFYEDKGLLAPQRHNGARVYGPEDQIKVEEILRAKRLGFSLEDIKIVMNVAEGKVTDRAELLERREDFQKVILSLRRRRKDIEILTAQMTELCSGIDRFTETQNGQSKIFKYVNAYDASLRKHMDDEFGFEDQTYSAAASPQ